MALSSIFGTPTKDKEYGGNYCKGDLGASPPREIEPLLLETKSNEFELSNQEAATEEAKGKDDSNSVVDDFPSNTHSKNIPLILTYTFVIFVGRSMWSQSVLSAMVYLMRNDNPESVGFLTA
eukprot:2326062-Ditylum_brightwellii.AAC.1